MEAEMRIMGEHHQARELSQAHKFLDSRISIWEEMLGREHGVTPEEMQSAVLNYPEVVPLSPLLLSCVVQVLGGLPGTLRRRIWLHFVVQNVPSNTAPGIYSELQENMRQHSEEALQPALLDDAVPEEQDVLDQAGVAKGAAALRRVLVGLVNFVPHTGYRPGMHILGAFLLLFAPEEDVFWLLVAATTPPQNEGFSLQQAITWPGVEGSVAADLVWSKLDPAVRCHLAKLGSEVKKSMGELLDSWLNKIFVGVVPPASAVRIWDCFLLLGPSALLRAAIALVLATSSRLQECVDAAGVVAALTRTACLWPEPGALLAAAFKEDASAFLDRGLRGITLEEVGSIDATACARLRVHHARTLLLGNDLGLIYGSHTEPRLVVSPPTWDESSPAHAQTKLCFSAVARETQIWGGGFGTSGEGQRWNAVTGADLAPIFNGGGVPPAVTCICDIGHAVWLGLKGGSIQRFDYGGGTLPELKEHNADIQFIMSWKGVGVLSGSVDGALLLWHMNQIGAVSSPIKFVKDGRRWTCVAEVVCTNQAWLAGVEGIAVFDKENNAPLIEVEVGKGVTAVCAVDSTSLASATVWAASCDGSVHVLAGSTVDGSRKIGDIVHIIPSRGSGVCSIAAVGTEVWSGHTDGTVHMLCQRTFGSLRVIGEHTATVCCIVPVVASVSQLMLAWVASEDGMVTSWVVGELVPRENPNTHMQPEEVSIVGSTGAGSMQTSDIRQGIVSGIFSFGAEVFTAPIIDASCCVCNICCDTTLIMGLFSTGYEWHYITSQAPFGVDFASQILLN